MLIFSKIKKRTNYKKKNSIINNNGPFASAISEEIIVNEEEADTEFENWFFTIYDNESIRGKE